MKYFQDKRKDRTYIYNIACLITSTYCIASCYQPILTTYPDFVLSIIIPPTNFQHFEVWFSLLFAVFQIVQVEQDL